MNNCNSLIRPALENAFSGNLYIDQDAEDCRITLPLERSDGDFITLWIIKRGEQYQITDEGETYGLLYLSNINLDQKRRKNRIQTVQERFGLDKVKEEISVTAQKDELGDRILDVIQAVQAMSYLTYTRRQYTQTDFRADVATFLSELGYRYDSNPDVSGISEPHRVDFSILDQNRPTYIEALHAEDTSSAKAMAQRTAYKWGDINAEIPDAHRISVIDDDSGEFGHDAERILENWSDALIPWTQNDRLGPAIVS